ncbi:hypothetical protein DESC_590030 [Desulfosarcina cetonica]|nr:hypothetical protein DESC_590030 [Desulfosarcina cetonica]
MSCKLAISGWALTASGRFGVIRRAVEVQILGALKQRLGVIVGLPQVRPTVAVGVLGQAGQVAVLVVVPDVRPAVPVTILLGVHGGFLFVVGPDQGEFPVLVGHLFAAGELAVFIVDLLEIEVAVAILIHAFLAQYPVLVAIEALGRAVHVAVQLHDHGPGRPVEPLGGLELAVKVTILDDFLALGPAVEDLQVHLAVAIGVPLRAHQGRAAVIFPGIDPAGMIRVALHAGLLALGVEEDRQVNAAVLVGVLGLGGELALLEEGGGLHEAVTVAVADNPLYHAALVVADTVDVPVAAGFFLHLEGLALAVEGDEVIVGAVKIGVLFLAYRFAGRIARGRIHPAVEVGVAGLQNRPALFKIDQRVGMAVVVLVLFLTDDLPALVVAHGFVAAVGVLVVAQDARLALFIEIDHPFDAAIAVAIGFLLDGMVVLEGLPDVDLAVGIRVAGRTGQLAGLEFMVGVEAAVTGGVPLHGQGLLLCIEADHLFQPAGLDRHALMAHAFFVFEDIAGVHGAVVVAVTLDGTQLALPIKLDLVEAAVGVAVDLQLHRGAAAVQKGHLVDFAIPVRVPLHAPLLRRSGQKGLNQ